MNAYSKLGIGIILIVGFIVGIAWVTIGIKELKSVPADERFKGFWSNVPFAQKPPMFKLLFAINLVIFAIIIGCWVMLEL